MSAVDGVQLAPYPADIVEIAALRGRAPDLQRIATERGMALPDFGRVTVAGDRLGVCVRPDRWLLLSPPTTPGAAADSWNPACAGLAAAVDLSCALAGLHLSGPSTRELLARGCRLDLDPEAFAVGHAAATIMAQVSVILVSLDSGMVVLTPSTTMRHFREWIISTAKPFGLTLRSDNFL